jgi:hypothetical protein
MNKRILALAGAAALAVPLAACSSGPPSPSSVLKADGYSHIVGQSGLAAVGNVMPQRDSRYISGYAAGYKPGGQAEVVFIVTQAGAAKITPAQLASGYHGVHISLSGDVMRLTGTQSQFSELP